jgi:hypothetical protein
VHTLVVGGTGMLSGATIWLAEQGHTVSVVSRRPGIFSSCSDPGRIRSITVDYRESDNLRRCIAEAIAMRGPIGLAVAWIHSDAPDALRVISDEISSRTKEPWRLFHVRGSAAYLHPEQPQVPINCLYRQVILGFVLEGDRSRWLTHEEISGGVIRAIQRDAERTVVGTLEPWDQRPE